MNEQTIYDQILGELTWNDDDECWVSQVQFNLEHRVNITVDPEDDETGAIILMARQYFVKLQNQEEMHIRRCIAEELLANYNDNWNKGENISIHQFIDMIKLEDIVFYANGMIQLFYHDGDLFAGHCIVASIDGQGVYQGAALLS
ncbi:DUF2262 domain-containing protein [Calothrix sp. NIES-3974]|uniref:DUF2262 domain-containing protein n=1 Tax=Calothrix sp. NIES-3974 TaxID=2005462 RepID=UPI000B5E56C8|nr:DUF2262 domain-containing protein [Calothrix sp. NIES-3974]BAZ05762.1 hypothetical protein NIES3974_24160 [Calothrix sp. NIES-3974]